MKKAVLLLGLLLLLTPTWVSVFFAIKPTYEPSLGLVLGMTVMFWGLASFMGWVLLLVYSVICKLGWIPIVLGTFLALTVNGVSFALLFKYEEIKREKHFADNKQILESIGDKILSHNIDLKTANKLLRESNVIFTPKLLFKENNCRAVFFFASGALDSQLGYFYQNSLASKEQCSGSRFARQLSSRWAFGAL